MLQEPPLIPDRILEAGLRSISRPNINFARSGPPIPNTPRTTGGPYFHTHGPGQRQIHIAENKVREETPLLTPTPTPTSINWWPYPPWGQSTVSATPVASSSPFSAAAVAVVASTVASASTIPLSATTSSATPNTPQATIISISALPPTNTLPSNPRVQAATGSHFNILYLVPVFVAVGLALGALCGLLGYRWYSRRRARKGGPSNGIRTRGREGSSFVPGPPYIPMLDDTEDARTALPTTTSPSKYTRHGASRAGRSWLSAVARAGSRRGSTHSSSIPPSRGSTTRATPSHSRPLSGSPTGARSRGSTISPGSLSDEENVPYETIRHTSIRRGIIERLQRGIDRRAPSRRTTQTYLSAPSAYSGTHTEDSRAPSAVPSSESPRDTDWIPGSGFRIVEEAISSPIPPSTAATLSSPTSVSALVAGLPGRSASAWDDRAAIRQAVDAHPGERWLAWTRSWASSPPQTNAQQQDRFTAVPARRRDDVGAALPRSPPQLTSGTLQSTLIFSPSLAPSGTARRHQPTDAAPAAVRGDSRASSIALGEGHGTPAMRYAARQTALARVEDILARSYSSRDLAQATASPGSPNAFGAAAVSAEEEEEDITLGAGLMSRRWFSILFTICYFTKLSAGHKLWFHSVTGGGLDKRNLRCPATKCCIALIDPSYGDWHSDSLNGVKPSKNRDISYINPYSVAVQYHSTRMDLACYDHDQYAVLRERPLRRKPPPRVPARRVPRQQRQHRISTMKSKIVTMTFERDRR
ncbi:hypothetical protein EDB92DRAFT_1818669 [Lactarius akahatsu]|uniref:Uncharacterized protein n=1 Tax=Lactarius akahatsu TaxID=416441 RepID=A0AAD4LC04_9AGAM|nr:hypothetical protein EDB92DRAFT_1818669 [Lactarius akahatsu]